MKITKPIEFLGAYVSSVEMSAGWSDQPGYCNLSLVEESKDGKIFKPPALGTGCIFKFGNAEFGGTLQRYEYSEDVSGGKRYSVALQSPNSILDGVQVILDKFQGTFYKSYYNLASSSWNMDGAMTYGGSNPTNLINIFAQKENYEYGGMFGMASNNELGYPVINFLKDIQATISKGVFGGKVKFANVEYELDLTELAEPISYIPQYRYSGDFTSLSAMITDICNVACYDYTVVLTGKTNSLGIITSDAKIKLKVLSRQSPPNPNVIRSIVDEYKSKPDKSKILSSYNLGKEYPNDIVTQKVLIGDQATRYWLADRDHILPVWGSLGTGENATYFHGNSLYEYKNMFSPIRVTIDGGDQNFTYVDTNLLELRCAIGGRESWTAYHILMALKEGRKGITIGNFSITESDFVDLLEGTLGSPDIMDTGIENSIIYSSWLNGRDTQLELREAYAQKIINTRFESLQKAAGFYGSQFLVSIPAEAGGVLNNIRFVESFKNETSWETADSGWAGDFNFLDFPDISFYDASGRFQSVVVYPNYDNVDYSPLGNKYGRTRLGTNYGVFTDATIDTAWGIKWLLLNVYNTDSGGGVVLDSSGQKISVNNLVGYVKVNIPAIEIYDEYSTEYNGFNSLCGLIFGRKINIGYHNLFGFGNLDFALPPSRVAPEFIGIPQRSNRYVWGPWFSFNPNSGQSGKTEIQHDVAISPETFGSLSDMNFYAQKAINAELATIVESETGSIELAEEPKFNLAERFFGSGPYVTSIAITADASGGYKTKYTFSTWTKNFGALSKYNIQLLGKSRQAFIEGARKIRELFVNPVPKAIDKNLIKTLERSQKEKMTSSNVIAGTFINYVSRAINGSSKPGASGTRKDRLSFAISAVQTNEAMRGLATNYTEGFAAGYEQLYSPVFAYNQIDPAKVKRNFNRGQI